MTTPDQRENWPAWLGDLKPETIYDDFGGLLVSYSARASDGRLVLVSLCGETREDQSQQYIITTTTPATLRALQAGRLTARQGATTGWMWLAVQNAEKEWLSAVAVEEEEVQDLLPEPGVMFTYELEAALRVRSTGPEISASFVQAGVITKTIESARKGLKSLVDHVLAMPGQGRPTQHSSSFYDLPVMTASFSSFEVSFSSPPRPVNGAEQLPIPGVEEPQPSPEEVFDEVNDEVWGLLSKGLDLLAGGELKADQGWRNEAEYSAVLAALSHLTPPQNGPIHDIHVSGALIESERERFDLTREMSRQVSSEIKSLKEGPRDFARPAVVVELNIPEMTFQIIQEGQDLETGERIQCVLDEDDTPGRDLIKESQDLYWNHQNGTSKTLKFFLFVGVLSPMKKLSVRGVYVDPWEPAVIAPSAAG